MSRYHLRDHARMFAARARNDAYAAALQACIGPRSVVLDIGTGCGLFAMMAARVGAARVYAVEPEPIVSLARTLAADNGLDGRITFIDRLSSGLVLPEPVDVIVADIRGVLPLAGGGVASLVDARDRLLRPGGTIIPGRDIIRGAVVAAPGIYADTVDVWRAVQHGVNGAAARGAAAQQLFPVDPADVTPLSEAVEWVTIDYRVASSPSVAGDLEWSPVAGTAHGFALWFEACLADGISYDTAPGAPGSADDLYGVAFFPWPDPVALGPGSSVRVSLRADYIAGAYVWTWRSAIDTPERPCRLEQSTFSGGPIALRRLPGRDGPA